MKNALSAGLLSAALTATVFATGVATPASAADLGSLKDGPMSYSPRSAGAGPCYFRADVGGSISQGPQTNWPVYNQEFADAGDANAVIDANEINYVFAGSEVQNVEMENTWLADVGIGCGSGSRGVRGEVVFGFRGDREMQGEPPFYNGSILGDPEGAPAPEVFDDPLHTSIKSYTLMFNLNYDLGNWSGFVPYIGAGVGAAYHQVSEVYFTDNPNLVNRIAGNNDVSLAWALMAGFGYQVSDRAILDVGYRYINMGKATSGRVDSAGFVNPAVVIDEIDAHEVKVGLRYHFGH